MARADLIAMSGYEPVEPVDAVAARLGIPEEQVVKLDGNENPYGPSPAVAEALARFPYYHIYPDSEQRRLRAAIAAYAGVDPEQIVAGSGSDEPLDLVARLFLSPGDIMVNAPPSFGMYPFLARLYSACLLEVPRLEDFRLDLPALESALGEGAKLLYLASPNNPTGNALSRDELERLLDGPAVVVVDEAYAEFNGESFVQMVGERNNLIVVRTFSKWAGLAGLRVGYGVFPMALVEIVRKIKMPYSVNVAAEVATLASLGDVETLLRRVGGIVVERERLVEGLTGLGWLRPFPSRANFVLCEVGGIAALEVRDRLREKGIMVRHFDTPALRSCLRFSVGKPMDTDRLLAALAEIGARVGR